MIRTPRELLDHCRLVGVSVDLTTTGMLRVQTQAGPLDPALRDELARHKNGIIALALMDATDAAVERFGSNGTDPVIQTAVKAVNEAYGQRDMAGVRAACGKIVERAKELAAHKSHKGAA